MTLLPLADIVNIMSPTVLNQLPNSTAHSFYNRSYIVLGGNEGDLEEANSHSHINQHISSLKRLIPRPTH
jgi:hypothetical protein